MILTQPTRWLTVPLAALSLLACLAFGARAEPGRSEDPQQLVAETIDELIDRLQKNSEQIRADSGIAYRISDELVAPHIDFPRVARLIIGKYWRGASETQREALIKEIQSLLIRSYVAAMTSYADQIVATKERIKYLPSRYKSGDKKASVRANIALDNGQAVEVQYQLYKGDGRWRIYDIVIEGVSLAITYRTSFGEQIRQDGIDHLITELEERNRRGDIELPDAIAPE